MVSVRGRKVVTQWFRASPATRVGAPAAAVVLAVSGLFGGLDAVPLTERVEQVKPGAEITVAPFTLTLDRAVAIDEIEDVIRPRIPGNRLMAVLLHGENNSDAPVDSVLLKPTSVAKSSRPGNLRVLDDRLAPISETSFVYDADTNAEVAVFNPGLTYHLAVVWEFSGPVPERLPLGLDKLTFRGVTISPDEMRWQDPEGAATVTLPVHDLTEGQQR